MVKILLKNIGGRNPSSRIVIPVSIEDLIDKVVLWADGFGELDGLYGTVYDDSGYDSSLGYNDTGYYPDELSYAAGNSLFESRQLLFTGGGDDGLEYREETDDYVDGDGNVYSCPEDAYEDWTRQDFDDSISDLWQAYEPHLKAYAEKKSSYYSDAAKKEDVDFVKVRYEEKAGFWGKISRGEEVLEKEIDRCGPDHSDTTIDNFVYYRNWAEKYGQKGDKYSQSYYLREMNELIPDAQKEMQEIIRMNSNDKAEHQKSALSKEIERTDVVVDKPDAVVVGDHEIKKLGPDAEYDDDDYSW